MLGFREDCDHNNRVVKQEIVEIDGTLYLVSTVDLGIDHSNGDGEALYFETMIFNNGGLTEKYCMRYGTREEATDQHEKVVRAMKDGEYEIKNGWFEFG